MERRSETARRSPCTELPTMGPAAASVGLSMVVALFLTGCPVGSTLDTPYQEYAPPPDSGVTTMTSDTSSTTGGPAGCTDADVNPLFQYWCGSASCHGDEGTNNASQPSEAPFWIFSPTRNTDWIGQAGSVTDDLDCSGEMIINGTNPSQSLLVSSLRSQAACGLEMPDGFPIPESDADVITCIESWVNGVVATQAGVVADPGVGGTSAL